MKKVALFLAVLLSVATLFAQNDEAANKIIKAGIALHDKGEYQAAIDKYDEALGIDAVNDFALYEKAFSLSALKKFDEAIAICKKVIELNPSSYNAMNAYVSWGNALDQQGKSKESLKVYDKAIDQFPKFHLLHYNKGVTLIGIKNEEEGMLSFQNALKQKPLHPSSNFYIGSLLKKDNKIPALLSLLTFLVAEPQSNRTTYAVNDINSIVNGNVKKEGNNVTISISPDLLTKGNKKKKEENDFSSIEMLFTLTAAIDNSEGVDSVAKTAASKMSLKLQLLFNSLKEGQNEGKGFYWKHYVPFFVQMKDKGMVDVLAHLYQAALNDNEAKKWLNESEFELKDFYDWVNSYKWE